MHGYNVQPFGFRLLWLLLTSHSSLFLRLMEPPARPHGISPQSFLVCLPDLRDWVTVAFWTLLSYVSSSAKRALYQVSVRQATISLSLLLACTSRCKPWESLWGSSATTPLMDFHHRLTACPSYEKKALLTNAGLSAGWRWIRTTEISDSRFTVCPLWPLGNPSTFTVLQYHKYYSFSRLFLLFPRGTR